MATDSGWRPYRLTRTLAVAITCLSISHSSSPAQEFEPQYSKALIYDEIPALPRQQLAFDSYDDQYMAVRLRSRPSGFYIDLAARHAASGGTTVTAWNPVTAAPFVDADTAELAAIVPTEDAALIACNATRELTDAREGWLISRDRGTNWSTSWIKRLQVGETYASLEVTDMATDGSRTYILGHVTSGVAGMRPFLAAIDSAGDLVWARLVLVKPGIRLKRILYHSGSVYVSGSGGDGGILVPPLILRFDRHTGMFGAGVQYDGMRVPWLGEQPAPVPRYDSTPLLLVSCDLSLNPTWARINGWTLEIDYTPQFYPDTGLYGLFLRDAILIGDQWLQLLFSSDPSSGFVTDTVVMGFHVNFPSTYSLFTLDHGIAPRENFLVPTIVGGAIAGRQPKKEPGGGNLQLHHSEWLSNMGYGCTTSSPGGYDDNGLSLATSQVAADSIAVPASLTGIAFEGAKLISIAPGQVICD